MEYVRLEFFKSYYADKIISGDIKGFFKVDGIIASVFKVANGYVAYWEDMEENKTMFFEKEGRNEDGNKLRIFVDPETAFRAHDKLIIRGKKCLAYAVLKSCCVADRVGVFSFEGNIESAGREESLNIFYEDAISVREATSDEMNKYGKMVNEFLKEGDKVNEYDPSLDPKPFDRVKAFWGEYNIWTPCHFYRIVISNGKKFYLTSIGLVQQIERWVPEEEKEYPAQPEAPSQTGTSTPEESKDSDVVLSDGHSVVATSEKHTNAEFRLGNIQIGERNGIFPKGYSDDFFGFYKGD